MSAVLFFNLVCISLLSIIVVVLSIATRLKGPGGRVALLIYIGTIPTHCYNLCRACEFYPIARWLIYPAFLNTLLMPLLWMFVRNQLEESYRPKSIDLLHFIPTLLNYIILLIFYTSLPETEQIQQLINENAGIRQPYLWVNDATVFLQMFIYFFLIFKCLYKTKQRYSDILSSMAQKHIKIMEKLIYVFAILFLSVFIAYAIDPRTDAWLIPILNTLLIAYLTYLCVANNTNAHYVAYHSTFNIETNTYETELQAQKNRLSDNDMAANCERIMRYITTDQHYLNPNFSIWDIATALNMPPALVSQSINGHLKHNFFDVINRLRIDEAKRLFTEGRTKTVSIERIAKECGFHARSIFYSAFKKYEGCTPTQWMKKLSV